MKSVKTQVFQIYYSIDGDSNSSESIIDPSILLAGKQSAQYQIKLKGTSVIPHCSDIGKTDSLEKVSICSFSSTSSKVSVNSKFMEVVRFSLNHNPNKYTKIYNKNNQHEVRPPKRKSKSYPNCCEFSRNLCRIMKKSKNRNKHKPSKQFLY